MYNKNDDSPTNTNHNRTISYKIIGSTLSDLFKLLFGGPQGSVEIKYHCYADDNQVYVLLTQKNSYAAFEQLNRCLDGVKERMSTSKLKMNPYKTEFIVFGSKRQMDKLKTYFPTTTLGSPL